MKVEFILNWSLLLLEIRQQVNYEVESVGAIGLDDISSVPIVGDRVSFQVSVNSFGRSIFVSGEVEGVAYSVVQRRDGLEPAYVSQILFLKLTDCFVHEYMNPWLRKTPQHEPGRLSPISENV